MKTCVVVLALIAALNVHAAQPLFPMHVGDSWEYVAEVQWTVMNSNKVKSATIPWKMTVVDAVDGPQARAFVVRGSPTRLAWYDPTESTEPAYDVFVIRPDGFWIADYERQDELQAHEIASKAAGGAIVGHQLLRFPLHSGDCIEEEDLEGPPGMYCWMTMALPSKSKSRSWELSYRTNPDHVIMILTEGVGITEYTYGHHGTIASAHAVLKKRLAAPIKKK